jgi:hypothetical protein
MTFKMLHLFPLHSNVTIAGKIFQRGINTFHSRRTWHSFCFIKPGMFQIKLLFILSSDFNARPLLILLDLVQKRAEKVFLIRGAALSSNQTFFSRARTSWRACFTLFACKHAGKYSGLKSQTLPD